MRWRLTVGTGFSMLREHCLASLSVDVNRLAGDSSVGLLHCPVLSRTPSCWEPRCPAMTRYVTSWDDSSRSSRSRHHHHRHQYF